MLLFQTVFELVTAGAALVCAWADAAAAAAKRAAANMPGFPVLFILFGRFFFVVVFLRLNCSEPFLVPESRRIVAAEGRVAPQNAPRPPRLFLGRQ
jgi:hypothetical protein